MSDHKEVGVWEEQRPAGGADGNPVGGRQQSETRGYLQIKLWTQRQTCSQSTDLVGGHRSLLLVAPVPSCSCFRFLAYRSSQQSIIFHNFFLYSLAWLLVRLCVLSSSCSFILFFLISSLSFILNITFVPSLVHPILNGEEFYMQNILSHLTATVQKHSVLYRYS